MPIYTGQPESHPLFPAFWSWAGSNGCQSDYYEDWKAWWECYLAGAEEGTKEANESRDPPKDW